MLGTSNTCTPVHISYLVSYMLSTFIVASKHTAKTLVFNCVHHQASDNDIASSVISARLTCRSAISCCPQQHLHQCHALISMCCNNHKKTEIYCTGRFLSHSWFQNATSLPTEIWYKKYLQSVQPASINNMQIFRQIEQLNIHII